MAGFKAHITGSTLVGIGYGAAGYAYGIPWPACVLAGGLCSVSGMLPDLDSDSGKPLREMIGLGAAVVPALMIPRFVQMGWDSEQIALAAIGIYAFIRFVVAYVFKRYTVHRGMWHSIPAALIVGIIAFLLVSGDELAIRLFKAASVTLGFTVHLIMDELWSLDLNNGRLRIKKSFGTALKFWNTGSLASNLSTYAKLIAGIGAVIADPYAMNQLGVPHENLPKSPQEWMTASMNEGAALWEKLKSGKLVSENSEKAKLMLSNAWNKVLEETDGSSWKTAVQDFMHEESQLAEPAPFPTASDAAPVLTEAAPALKEIPSPPIETATRPTFSPRY